MNNLKTQYYATKSAATNNNDVPPNVRDDVNDGYMNNDNMAINDTDILSENILWSSNGHQQELPNDECMSTGRWFNGL